MAGHNVTFERDVSPERLRELYRGARALVYPCEEDFGIVMAEALACGTPVIGLRAGGALDIVDEGFSGRLVDRADPRCVADAVEDVAASDFDHTAISRSAQRFSGTRYRQEMRRIAQEVVGASGARIPATIRPSAGRALQ
jgi:glycosyltransferase involved in cell wall biosynthesis